MFFMLFYESHYETLDAYGYFYEGIRGENLGFYGTDLIKSIVYVFSFIIGKSYRGYIVLFAFSGFIGAFLFYKALSYYIEKKNIS